MITVKEVFGVQADCACARFGFTPRDIDRVFEMSGECGGVGLTRLENGAIRIGGFITDGDVLCRELLLRTLLYDATRVKNFKVVMEQDGDYSAYGFKKTADGWSANSDEIIFPHECKGDKNVK